MCLCSLFMKWLMMELCSTPSSWQMVTKGKFDFSTQSIQYVLIHPHLTVPCSLVDALMFLFIRLILLLYICIFYLINIKSIVAL